jgi:hypothetical protein
MNKKNLLKNVPSEKVFYCKDGRVFENIEQLKKALTRMKANIFSFHVNSEKNDFANWIYDVIGDTELSNKLRKTTDKKETKKKIDNRISAIKKNIKTSSKRKK